MDSIYNLVNFNTKEIKELRDENKQLKKQLEEVETMVLYLSKQVEKLKNPGIHFGLG